MTMWPASSKMPSHTADCTHVTVQHGDHVDYFHDRPHSGSGHLRRAPNTCAPRSLSLIPEQKLIEAQPALLRGSHMISRHLIG